MSDLLERVACPVNRTVKLSRKTYCIFISSYPQIYNGLHARNLQILIHCIALSGSSFRLTTIELKSWISYFRFKSQIFDFVSVWENFESFWIEPIKLSTFSSRLHFINSSRKRPKLSLMGLHQEFLSHWRHRAMSLKIIF